jgi:hypothetical protein
MASQDELKSVFSGLLQTYTDKFAEVKRKVRSISLLRITIFLVTVLGIYVTANWGWIYLLPVAITGTILFIFLVYRHGMLFRKRDWFERLIQINTTELKLLEGNTASLDNGSEFIIPGHAFSEDLDIFGNRSLFQLINRCTTASGRERLAQTLNEPITGRGPINARQKAVRELSDKLSWRQHFQATGISMEERAETMEELNSWGQEETTHFNRMIYRSLLWINPLLGLTIILLISFSVLPFGVFLLYLLLPFSVLGTRMSQVNKVHEQLGRKGEVLSGYAELFSLAASENFTSGLLNDIQDKISTGSNAAQQAIDALARISKAFDYRLNFLVGIILNIFLLWDIRQCIRLEKWKAAHGKEMGIWFDNLATLDELCSFAGFAYAHSDSVYPVIHEDSFTLQAKNAKHPFIPRAQSVGNDIQFSGWKQFQVITGANMAGKSTYLRTVGVNLILAMTGAPVLAESFTFTPVNLFTGIKTSDSLQDGESYFFAELKRLHHMIQRLEGGEHLFVILDEILRGTNSHDKRRGSMALLRQLIRLGASGMIATHDLSLGELAKEFPGHVDNKCFEVDIKKEELVFDYKLRPGISQNLNASFLMEKMGIVLKS